MCSQFKGRLRSALSTPSLTSLAEKPEPAPAHAPAAPRQPVRRSSSSSGGLFGCFSKPAVRDDYPPDLPSPTSTLGSPREGSQPAYGSLHGGSERSVRAGVVRDPSVRGAQRATTIEVLADVDTALWEAEDFGNAPFPPSSRLSIDGLRRLSPSGVVNGLAGCSINSAQSGEHAPLMLDAGCLALLLAVHAACCLGHLPFFHTLHPLTSPAPAPACLLQRRRLPLPASAAAPTSCHTP